MSYGVKGRIFIQIIINGEEIPLDNNTCDFLHIVESARLYLPMLTFKILDATKFLTQKNLLVDGAKITVTLDVMDERDVYYFRLFSSREQVAGGLTYYLIRGYLDAYRYWTESMVSPLKGSASDVLKKLAGAGGLTYEGPTTSDTQLWIPANRRNCSFAVDVARHAYVSDTSCFQIAVTNAKKMIGCNIAELPSMPVVEKFTNKEHSAEMKIVTDFGILNRGGFFNADTGYKEYRFVQSVMNTQDPKSIKDVTVNKNSLKLMVSQEIKGVKQNKVGFSPIDVGNVHENYERAEYQNNRLSNLFNFGLEIITPLRPKVNLFEAIHCEISKPDVDSVEQYNGKFLLTSKVVYVAGAVALYKLEGYRHGLNSNKEETQV